MRGYHVEWKKNSNRSNEKNQPEKKSEQPSDELALKKHHENKMDEILPTENSSHTDIIQDIASSSVIPRYATPSFEEKYLNEKCDTIILKDGQKITAKISNISGEIVSFVKCNDAAEKAFKIEKSSISMIRYANGNRDIFTTLQKGQEPTPVASTTKKTEVFAVLSLVFAIVGIIITLFLSILGGGIMSLVALIFGIVGSSRIAKNPNVFKGKGIAIAGTVLGVIGLVLAIIFMAELVQLLNS
jgi:hypothetical protein